MYITTCRMSSLTLVCETPKSLEHLQILGQYHGSGGTVPLKPSKRKFEEKGLQACSTSFLESKRQKSQRSRGVKNIWGHWSWERIHQQDSDKKTNRPCRSSNGATSGAAGAPQHENRCRGIHCARCKESSERSESAPTDSKPYARWCLIASRSAH